MNGNRKWLMPDIEHDFWYYYERALMIGGLGFFYLALLYEMYLKIT